MKNTVSFTTAADGAEFLVQPAELLKARFELAEPQWLLLTTGCDQSRPRLTHRRRSRWSGDASPSIIFVGDMNENLPNIWAVIAICHMMACNVPGIK